MIKEKHYVDSKGNKMIYEYTDKNGMLLSAYDSIEWDDGKIEKLYPTVDGELGVDATNPKWIENGRAVPCEYGIYPLSDIDTTQIVKM